MEMTVAVEELLKRVPEFSLDGRTTWSEGTVRGPRKLPIRIG
jgi:cytochrome P450